ncbi:MAG TPA: hypothetical protein P5205_20030 [Candidatus Paceibacterota bacterium]|nr:hypothetical protein [Verrucomicrobiota bacterium]HSA12655.1 hypothetical protein [Candidatus Paceibacterota bacterium]
MKARHILLAFLTLSCAVALAEDTYYHIPLTSLKLAEGALPTGYEWKGPAWRMAEALQPYAVLDGEREAYVGGGSIAPWSLAEQAFQNRLLVLRMPNGRPPTGRLFVPNTNLSGMVALKFKVAAASASAASKREFFKAKEDYYRNLRQQNIPGGAWFRHQESEAAKASGTNVMREQADRGFNPRRPGSWDDSYDSTYDLFSGGRALSENLQLDRLLTPVGTNTNLVALSTLTGVTVREMDWKTLLQDRKPALDPLAAHIPFDQHALFFSTFEAMSRWIDEADQDGTPVLQIFEPRAEDANSRGRYQKQLCLELNALSRLIGPQLIASAAFTGSDPYLRTGSDLAVLFETTSPAMLKALLQARQAAAQQANPAVKAVKGDIAGVAYTGMISEDRAVCSYVAALEDAVLVSNSRAQLERIISVAKGKTPALASQDDYRYFRQKYPRTEPGETGFLVLSDATIRRWCGPQWRIANSRRTRAAAVLTWLQAAHADELATGQAKPGCIATNLPEVGDVLLTTNGVLSATYGTIAFLTPILELPLTQATQAEADAYNRWREGYQRNWSQVFDPIAIRFSLQPERLSAELSVMPLIAGSEYRQFILMSSGGRIAPDAGDPHPEALLHLALAINAQSEPVRESGNFLGGFSPLLKVNPLGWLGQCLAIYADQDPFWDQLSKAAKSSEFLEKSYPRLPVALYCQVKNPLGVTAFLTTVRGFVEQSAPHMTTWENLEYNGQAYVKVTASQQTQAEGGVTNLCVYYAVTPNSLVLTLSESVLKRALDRQHTQVADRQAARTNALPAQPWLGTNLCLRVDQSFVPTLECLFRDGFRPAQQRLAWSNLPILNEWKRRYPQQDPVKLHERLWHTTLVCPGGGHYVWNEQWQTMESTVYGHPAQPKPGPEKILPVANVTSANLGVSFENQGLSAKAVLERNASKSVP